MKDIRYRHIHLDFHTSELIDGIGRDYNRQDFQAKLQLGHVDSINIFAKCHHGWAYHPTTANEMHPNLKFDLLGEMIDACHEIGVKAPIYISAGLDEKMARRHPEWLIRNADDSLSCFGVLRNNFMMPGYHELCFNSPYLDYLLKQIEEILTTYPCDGLWLDIVGERQCYCQNCVKTLLDNGRTPENAADIRWLSQKTYGNYVAQVAKLVKRVKPGTPIFHNSGHIHKGRRDLLAAVTHAEIESLPTGGWGYEDYPLTARYVQNKVGFFLGMTGKFHTTWGEFGGFKHPKALQYETALMLANGGGCSIGDQMHPTGSLEKATYKMIGDAYKLVEEKEAWCQGVEACVDVGFVSVEAAGAEGCVRPDLSAEDIKKVDIGGVKVLQEGHFLYDVIDLSDDFNRYKVVILPDYIRITPSLKDKVEAYVKGGGKILATGESGLGTDGDRFEVDFGVRYVGEERYKPNYCLPDFDLPNIEGSPFVQYSGCSHVVVTTGTVLAEAMAPYFNRRTFSFSSHQHAPYNTEDKKAGIVMNGTGIYGAWKSFSEYATVGNYITRDILIHCIDTLLSRRVTVNLPAQGVVTLMHQKEEDRYVLHLLYAATVKRGDVKISTDPRDSVSIEVIEDILPLTDISVEVNLKPGVKKVYLAPQGKDVPFEQGKEGSVRFKVDKMTMHQMVVIAY